MKRQRKFRVTPELLDQIFTAKPNERGDLFKGITSDLPDDTRIVWIGQSRTAPADWLFICEHESFGEVPEGGDPVEVSPIFAAHYDEQTNRDLVAEFGDGQVISDLPPDVRQRLECYLDAAVTLWRERGRNGHEHAILYIDAFQSMRTSVLGETLP